MREATVATRDPLAPERPARDESAIYPTLFDDIPAPIPQALPRSRVGVLFVHGMGSQARGDTLREMASPMIDWLHEWHRDRVEGFTVLSSNVSPDPWDETPPHTMLRLPANDGSPSQTWVLTEAWWAARLRAPSYGTMLGWVVLLLWRELTQRSEAAFRNFGEAWNAIWFSEAPSRGTFNEPSGAQPPMRPARYPLPLRLERFAARSIDGLNSLLLAIVYFALAFWGLIPLALLLAIVRLPIPFLRPVLMAIERLLVEDLGDVYTYLYDDLQATQVRDSVTRALRWLVDIQGCTQVVVVAHSQGTVVAVDALGSEALPERLRARVSRLVTVGQALNIAWGAGKSQGKAPRRIPRYLDDIPWTDVWAEFDYANGEALRIMGPLTATHRSIRIANEKNVLTEHSSYFANHEQFTLPLVDEIEMSLTRAPSRFRPDSEPMETLLRLRRIRITALSGLGFVTALSGIAAFLRRYWQGGLADDATAVWGLIDLVPGASALLWLPLGLLGWVLSIPAFLFDVLMNAGRVQPGVVRGFELVGSGINELLVLSLYALIAIAFFAIPFVAGYMALFISTYQPWHRIASLHASRPARRTPRRWLSRTVRPWVDVGRFGVGFLYAIIGYFVIVDLPALPAVFAAIRAGLK